VDLSETSWQQLGAHPQPHREESARKGAETQLREREKNNSNTPATPIVEGAES
jgi:hypothetical protein